MSLQGMMRDTVTLVKQDGAQYHNIKASVQNGKIITFEKNAPIEDGDVFQRKLPNGVVENYKILDSGYHSSIGGIEAHYQAQVKKISKVEVEPEPANTVYNLYGHNSRINIHSADSSSNVINIGHEVVFQKLRDIVEQQVSEQLEKQRLLVKIDELEKSRETKEFVSRYSEFVSLAANHISIFAPVLPALTQMLTP